MPNGYSEAMHIFTKMLKPLFSNLIKQDYVSVTFMDESYLQGSTRVECSSNVKDEIDLLISLGYITHITKSVLESLNS